jgi:hypothetical protein
MHFDILHNATVDLLSCQQALRLFRCARDCEIITVVSALILYLIYTFLDSGREDKTTYLKCNRHSLSLIYYFRFSINEIWFVIIPKYFYSALFLKDWYIYHNNLYNNIRLTQPILV